MVRKAGSIGDGRFLPVKPVVSVVSDLPVCAMCGRVPKEGDTYVDGATVYGPWGYMCDVNCFQQFGVGLGTGRGQRYKVVNNRPVKVGG